MCRPISFDTFRHRGLWIFVWSVIFGLLLLLLLLLLRFSCVVIIVWPICVGSSVLKLRSFGQSGGVPHSPCHVLFRHRRGAYVDCASASGRSPIGPTFATRPWHLFGFMAAGSKLRIPWRVAYAVAYCWLDQWTNNGFCSRTLTHRSERPWFRCWVASF